MSIDIIGAVCQKTTSAQRFGLYDGEDQKPAIIKLNDEPSWNATVNNINRRVILFTAIDNCIDLFKENGEMDSRCDCMLSYDSSLFLIELKNKRDAWQSDGLGQIANIARKMIEEIPEFFYGFKKRKAVVANRKNQFPAFHESNAEQRQYFSSKFKMRIQFDAEINIE